MKIEYEYLDKIKNEIIKYKVPKIELNRNNLLKIEDNGNLGSERLKIKVMSEIWKKEIPFIDKQNMPKKFKKFNFYGKIEGSEETYNFEMSEIETKNFLKAKISKFDNFIVYVKPFLKKDKSLVMIVCFEKVE